MRINIGTMMTQICINKSSALVSPEKPSTRESVTPLNKNPIIKAEKRSA
jgi:hypothetical protein